MQEITDERIEVIQASGYKVAMVVTGGGIGAVSALLRHPGASRFLLEAQIPYSAEAMFDYLGEQLESFCSAEAAVILAERAFERAMVFQIAGNNSYPIMGVSCTAALQTTRERKGKDRAFICIKTREQTITRELEVAPAGRNEQDDEVSGLLLNTMDDFIAEAKA